MLICTILCEQEWCWNHSQKSLIWGRRIRRGYTRTTATLWATCRNVYLHAYKCLYVLYVHVLVRVCACLLLGCFWGGNCFTCCSVRSTHDETEATVWKTAKTSLHSTRQKFIEYLSHEKWHCKTTVLFYSSFCATLCLHLLDKRRVSD